VSGERTRRLESVAHETRSVAHQNLRKKTQATPRERVEGLGTNGISIYINDVNWPCERRVGIFWGRRSVDLGLPGSEEIGVKWTLKSRDQQRGGAAEAKEGGENSSGTAQPRKRGKLVLAQICEGDQETPKIL